MSKENVETARGVRYPISLPRRASQRRSLDERLFLRFPAVYRLLADRVTRALLRNRCPSDALTIEITESQLMADPGRAADALRELHELGVRISIDDFGTGFSSFSSLRELPIDEVVARPHQ